MNCPECDSEDLSPTQHYLESKKLSKDEKPTKMKCKDCGKIFKVREWEDKS